MITFKIDLRARECETRKVRNGNSLVFQFRNNIINLDNSVIYGEWQVSGVIPNYGDCFDKKVGFFRRFLNLINKPL